MAAANGARLVAFEQLGDDDRVTVELSESSVVARSSARARVDGSSGGGGGGGPPLPVGLTPAMRAAITRLDQLLGAPPVAIANVVRPGLVVDVDTADLGRISPLASQAGLCQAEPVSAPTRFSICPVPTSALSGIDETNQGGGP